RVRRLGRDLRALISPLGAHRRSRRAHGVHGGQGQPTVSNGNRRHVFSPHFAQHVADLAHRRAGADGVEYQRYQVVLGPRGLLEALERLGREGGSARRAKACQALDLFHLDARIDLGDGDLGPIAFELVYPHHDAALVLNVQLITISGGLDIALHEALLDGAHHAAHLVDAGDVVARAILDTFG